MDAAHFFFEMTSVEDLAVIGLAETELIDVIAQPGQVAELGQSHQSAGTGHEANYDGLGDVAR